MQAREHGARGLGTRRGGGWEGGWGLAGERVRGKGTANESGSG